jgi:hypothetical protein
VIDERFNADAFATARADLDALRALCRALEAEMAAALRPAIEPALLAVVERLRELGHTLEPEAPVTTDDPRGVTFGDYDKDDLALWIHHQSVPIAAIAGIQLEDEEDG